VFEAPQKEPGGQSTEAIKGKQGPATSDPPVPDKTLPIEAQAPTY
jgi:hypothetical protein